LALQKLLGKKGFLKIKMKSMAVVSISALSLYFSIPKEKK